MTSFLDIGGGRRHVSAMTPEIRIVVLDTTGPTARLTFELCPRRDALAFHGLQNEKPRLRVQAGRAKLLERVRS